MLLKQFPTRDDFVTLSHRANVLPVACEILADTETPVSLLGKFYRWQPDLFLFESVEGGERWGRYSFLGTSARSHVRVFPEVVAIHEEGHEEQIPHAGRPLQVLKQRMQTYRPASVAGLPRFWGGMVGYLTYEFVSFIEEIPHQWPADKPLAHFIIPDELIIFDNVRHTLTALIIVYLEEDGPSAHAAYDQAAR